MPFESTPTKQRSEHKMSTEKTEKAQPSAAEIRQCMDQVRCDLGTDVGEFVESARDMADWRVYVRRYPWVMVGVAAAVGYFVVPKKLELVSPDTDTMLELAKKNKLVVKANPEPKKKGGLFGAAFQLITNAAVRSLIAYAGQKTGKATGEKAAEPA